MSVNGTHLSVGDLSSGRPRRQYRRLLTGQKEVGLSNVGVYYFALRPAVVRPSDLVHRRLCISDL